MHIYSMRKRKKSMAMKKENDAWPKRTAPLPSGPQTQEAHMTASGKTADGLKRATASRA